ncbi:MAG TPA: SOS response-associated peptidase [Fulvivirga sp.]|nr:SOS response-associated peptidase [Fulvivirga sp.]
MGDRYTLTVDAETLSARFDAEVSSDIKARYNAAPTQLLPVITQGSSGFSFFHWGQIPGWSKNKTISNKLIFAELETLEEKFSTKNALAQRRCLIPIDGYYDWKRISKKGRVAHRIVFGEQEIVALAGIWEEFEDEQEKIMHTFRIITTTANETIGQMNSRMPVVLGKNNESLWLDNKAELPQLMEILLPYPDNKISMYSVSPKIENPANEGPSLIKPFAPADQFGNYSLFD